MLDDNDRVSVGSRSICVAKRTLEIFGRLGVGDRCLEKGVTWSAGKVLRGDRLLYAFDLAPEEGHGRPAFVNLQQYYVETFLVDRFRELGAGGPRWLHRVTDVAPDGDRVMLAIDTPEGPYRLTCDWLVAADGVKSTVRAALGLPFVGGNLPRLFPDRRRGHEERRSRRAPLLVRSRLSRRRLGPAPQATR